jgi:hypothetical protein
MSFTNRPGLLTFAAVILSTTFIAGCAVRAGYYDPYYHDRHRWATEEPYYDHWERETHRRHEEFRRRQRQEQREYWEWRHHQH